MKKYSKALLCVDLLGIGLSRAAIMGLNPIGMGFFGATYMIKKGRLFTFMSVLTGLFLSLPLIEAMKYTIIMLAASIIIKLMENKNTQVGIYAMAFVVSVVDFLVSCSTAYIYSDITSQITMCFLEALIIGTFMIVFHKGIEWLVKEKGHRIPGNEEIISISLLISVFIYACTDITYVKDLFAIGFGYFSILCIAYKYGAGFGAVLGTMIGISLSLQKQDYVYVAVMCVLGLAIGVFRELGRVLTSFSYLAAVVLIILLFDEHLIDIREMWAMLAPLPLFLLLPRKIMRRIDVVSASVQDSIYMKNNFQNLTQTKLKEFSNSFYKLSSTFQEITRKKNLMSVSHVSEIIDDVTNHTCSNCTNCNVCWKNNYSETYHDMKKMFGSLEDFGYIELNEIPDRFSKRCINVTHLLTESMRLFETAKLNMAWQNRLAESREAIAGQLNEVAAIIDDFSNDLYRTSDVCETYESQIKHALKSNRISVGQLTVLEKKDKRQQIYVVAKAHKGECLTTKELATIIGEVLHKPMRPVDGSKNVISKSYETYSFIEDTTFKVLTGTARMTKQGEKISGDNFSFLNLDNGKTIMSLCDGMGTGMNANAESESVIELLEEFMETGFKEESAIRLINSILVLRQEDQSFSTIDLSIVDLYTGVCEFVKIGASATFIKRDNWVETISSTTMPAGIFNQVDFDQKVKKLYDGDYVIMMTDGVLDCISGTDKEKYIQKLLMDVKTSNPQEIANYILKETLAQNDNIPIDDMTVLVVGMFHK